MEKIRIGIIGCGGMSKSHQVAVKELEDIAVYTCTCDIDEEKAKAAAELLGCEHYFTDWTKMTDYVDAVLVVLPHHLHYECGMYFIRHHKHVLMEKPMANTEYEVENLILSAEKEGVTLMCAYPVPYWPDVIKLKELVDSGEYGTPFQMSVWTEQFTKFPDGHWSETKRSLGGGQFFSHGCHYVDIILRFMGRPVRGFHMGNTLGTPWMEGEGTSNMVMQFENGAMAYHMGTWGAKGTHHGWDIQIHCTEGMLELSRSAGKIFLYLKELGADNPKVLYDSTRVGKSTQLETRHFLECIRDGKTPLTDGRTALQGLRCIWRMYEAEKTNNIADLRGLGLDEPCIIEGELR